MKEDNRLLHSKLVNVEKQTTKLFLFLFYILFISFDAFYYLIYPLAVKGKIIGIPHEGLGVWLYILVLALLPFAIYLLKENKPFIVKYLYLFGYLSIDFIHNLIIYLNSDQPFQSGNIAEILFILFTPIFVNRRYFWVASSTLIGKYILFGIILRDSHVLLPIVIFVVFTAIAFLILSRFFSYINSVSSIHEEYRHQEKLAVIGKMATTIGHEIRNPLASLRGFSQLQYERNPESSEFHPIMLQELDRINIIVNDLMYLGKPKRLNYAEENVEEIISYTLSLSNYQVKEQGIIIKTIIEENLPSIECDGHQIKQLFINLFKNAIESMPNGGEIKINVKLNENKSMAISILDQGYGIPEEQLNSLGEPFNTTKIEGTGLGLMVCKQIITDHGGRLLFESKLDVGTKVDVILPIRQLCEKNSTNSIIKTNFVEFETNVPFKSSSIDI